jgi:hypothetical protein
MKRAWLVALVVVAGMGARGEECPPGTQLLTVYTLKDKTFVPPLVRGRAKYMAAKVLAGAGVTVEWAKRELPTDPQRTSCRERLAITFDAQAPEGYAAHAMAYTDLDAGWPVQIHVFWDRVSVFHDRSRMRSF